MSMVSTLKTSTLSLGRQLEEKALNRLEYQQFIIIRMNGYSILLVLSQIQRLAIISVNYAINLGAKYHKQYLLESVF